MANTTLSPPLRGLCPAPFYDASKFDQGGFIEGRFCAPVNQIHMGLVCCLPCPMTDYIYPPDFNTYYRVAEWLNVTSLILLLFLLVTFTVLPAEKTRLHYLSFCTIIAAIMMAFGFVIPLGVQPEQCYNEITPNDMYSSLTCAFSGAFLIAGGLSIVVWIFIRVLSMHLQICWDVTPGNKFFWWAQGLGWSVAATFFTITITITGVSFRFGDVCHVNAAHSMADFWGPLLAISGAAMVVQIATFGYCTKVYLQNMFSPDETAETQSSAGLPSYTTSVGTLSARAVYRRVRKVLWLQWRGITIVVFILIDVIFFSVVFIWLNDLATKAKDNVEGMAPFLICLMTHAPDPSPCFPLGQKLAVNEPTVIAVLMMLSIAGIQVFLLQSRVTMYTGWVEFFRNKCSTNREFVSLNAKYVAETTQHHELKHFDNDLKQLDTETLKSPRGVHTPSADNTGYGSFRSDTPDHFSKEAQREYKSPKLSFSTPRPPTLAATQADWDPRSTHARGGLGLHPPGTENKI